MSTKEIIQDVVMQLPEDVSFDEAVRRIQFVAAVREGLAELERGERIPIEQIKAELPSWIIR